MQFNSGTHIRILLISLALAGCTSVPPQVAAPTPQPPAAKAEQARLGEPVVENLLSDALRLGNEPVPIDEEEDGPQQLSTTVPMTANRLVERAFNDLLQNRRGVLHTWTRRSHTYFPMIEKIFAEAGVPDELKYLTLQESSLYPTIRSTAGAVGMWQFMAATAKGEGLRVDGWVDERRDPEKATKAAAKHLKALNDSYQGNWHLTLAGYNCSYRCITRAVEKAGGSIEKAPSFWRIYPHLPQQTREFVPRFIAASQIVSNPEVFGIHVENLGDEFAFDVVKIQGMLLLEDAARYAGTDVATLRELNPALLRGSLPDDNSPYELRIPAGSFDQFVSAFKASPPNAAKGAGEYIVKSGDTLDRIARTYKTTVDELKRANNLSSNKLSIKQKLLLPGMGSAREITLASEERVTVAYGTRDFKPIKLASEFRLVRQSGSTPEEPLMAVSLNQAEPDEGVFDLAPTIYKVKSGDTLASIAKRYGVSIDSLQKNNNLKSTKLMPNQELTVHAAVRPDPALAAEPKPAPAKKVVTYQVKQGDSLYQIAQRFGVTVENLKRWNGLNDNRITPGMSLQLN